MVVLYCVKKIVNGPRWRGAALESQEVKSQNQFNLRLKRARKKIRKWAKLGVNEWKMAF